MFAASTVIALSRGDRFAAAFYALGIALSCMLGLAGLVAGTSGHSIVARYSGLEAARPVASALAFVGALGLAGFPLLPTFWGEDLLVSATLRESRGFALALAGILALNGYLALRNFAYTFFGRCAGSLQAAADLDRCEGRAPPARRRRRARPRTRSR